MIKYGVVGLDTVLRDLTAWDTLLVAGRLHKPVDHIVQDSAVMAAISANLQAALAASLLMLPQGFTTQVLHCCTHAFRTRSGSSGPMQVPWRRRRCLRASAGYRTWETFAWALPRISTRCDA